MQHKGDNMDDIKQDVQEAVAKEITKRNLETALDAIAASETAAQDFKNSITLQELPDHSYAYVMGGQAHGSIETLVMKIKQDRPTYLRSADGSVNESASDTSLMRDANGNFDSKIYQNNRDRMIAFVEGKHPTVADTGKAVNAGPVDAQIKQALAEGDMIEYRRLRNEQGASFRPYGAR